MLPTGYLRLRVVTVTSFEAVIAIPFLDGVNAVCWQRSVQGDFDEVVRQLAISDDITSIDEARLMSLDVSKAGREALDLLLDDQRLLRAVSHEPSLDCVRRYQRDHDQKSEKPRTH